MLRVGYCRVVLLERVVCLVSCFLVLLLGDALQSSRIAGLAFLDRF